MILKKKDLASVFLILLIIALFDIVVGNISKKLILNIPDIGVNQTNAVQAMFKRNPDVLILGPSSANHHYNCKIIQDSLHLSAYNAGRDGQNIVYSTMVLKATVERYIPRIVILDISDAMIDGDWNSHLSDMYCYYGISNQVDSIIRDICTWQDQLKLNMNLYKYNNTFPWILNGYLATPQSEMNGYRPMPIQNGKMKMSITRRIFKADEMDMKYLDLLVSTCKAHQIKLFVCSSPRLSVIKSDFSKIMENYCTYHHLPYYNWNGDTTYTSHPDLFYDMSHLNSRGADKFTKEIVQILKDGNI